MDEPHIDGGNDYNYTGNLANQVDIEAQKYGQWCQSCQTNNTPGEINC